MTDGAAEGFGGLLRRLRIAAGYSQKALAERAASRPSASAAPLWPPPMSSTSHSANSRPPDRQMPDAPGRRPAGAPRAPAGNRLTGPGQVRVSADTRRARS